ncbi:hypothetical protein [Verrucomicrobium sp. BvORR106]|uniref:hypothetical protein n=1 Tax=Verrucomicrobium sp. BvORR106 TaxID=1403819 RepID=UPI00056F65BB|nr:hypothetical protein [Verrucomicrobium sp. BvORR106]
MKHLALVLIALSLPAFCVAQNPADVRMQFVETELRDVLQFYEKLTARPVYASLDLQAVVSVGDYKPLSKSDAADHIQSILLERYGIELRTTEKGETLAGWSKDPKYPRRTDKAAAAPRRRLMTPAEAQK